MVIWAQGHEGQGGMRKQLRELGGAKEAAAA